TFLVRACDLKNSRTGSGCTPTLHLVVAAYTKCVWFPCFNSNLLPCSSCKRFYFIFCNLTPLFFVRLVFHVSGGRGPVNSKGLRFYKNLIQELKTHGKVNVIICLVSWKEDVRLMYDMGLDALRLSISWSRLIPSGRGPVNSKGLRFYKNLIQELKTHGIEPHVTLHHNDLPQALEDEYGGWINRKILGDFTAFADVCFKEFGNAVKFWSTINEPNIVAWVGYDLGSGPPSHCSPPFGMVNCSKGNSSTEPYIALHNMLLAHASTARLYKQKYKASHKQNGFVGIACFAFWMVPFTSSEEDEIATQRAKDFLLGWVLHPLVFGNYPNVMRRIVGNRLPNFSEEESYLVKDSSDFLESWDSYTTQQRTQQTYPVHAKEIMLQTCIPFLLFEEH
ncbi:hypothetical protein DY000_02023277, partial [Brassica cretica]